MKGASFKSLETDRLPVDDRRERGIINKARFLNSQERLGPQAEVEGRLRWARFLVLMQSKGKKRVKVTLKPSELRAFLYGGCYNFINWLLHGE